MVRDDPELAKLARDHRHAVLLRMSQRDRSRTSQQPAMGGAPAHARTRSSVKKESCAKRFRSDGDTVMMNMFDSTAVRLMSNASVFSSGAVTVQSDSAERSCRAVVDAVHDLGQLVLETGERSRRQHAGLHNGALSRKQAGERQRRQGVERTHLTHAATKHLADTACFGNEALAARQHRARRGADALGEAERNL